MPEWLLSLLTGGATGLLGTGLTFAVDYFKRRQAHKHELALRKVDLDITRAESDSAERVAAIEAEGEAESKAWDGLMASYREAMARWSRGDSKWLVFVDVVRGLTRPAGAWAFLGLTGAIYFTLGADDAEIRARIIDTVLYLTTTSWMWWYGARQVAKAAK